MSNEFEWAEVPYPVTVEGHSDATPGDPDEHQPHSFLYVPDLSSEKGWAAHRVPERNGVKAERREMGFRR